MSVRNVVSNLAQTTLMALAGVNVPLAFWPAPVRWLANALPVTHGLAAVRQLIAGSDAGPVLANVGLEALVGACWLALALLTFDRPASSGRRDGSIEFTS
jgi:ABC-2 type transport system permease protein